MGRFWQIVAAKWNALLGRAENTEEQLDLAYEKQVDLLYEVRSSIASVTTAKKRVEKMLDQRGKAVQKLTGQAETAVQQGREDLARQALTRAQALRGEITELSDQHAEIQAREDALLAGERDMTAKVDASRTGKEVMKARYQSAEAMVQIGEATTGLGKNIASTGRMLARAEDRIEQMDARAAALTELSFNDAFTGSEGRIDRELAQFTDQAEIEKELEAIKQKQLGAGAATS